MSTLPQLHMRKKDMSNLPALNLPDGLSIHTHVPGKEKEWEDLVEKSFGERYPFSALLSESKDYVGGYKPEHVFYVSKDGKDIATATGMEKDIYPGEGWFRMVGTDPEARGLGAGKLVCLAALHSLAERGYKSVVLSTDDERIPAISMYLSLGFEPMYIHEKDEERWESVMKIINERRK